jgi:hypothetical protein
MVGFWHRVSQISKISMDGSTLILWIIYGLSMDYLWIIYVSMDYLLFNISKISMDYLCFSTISNDMND